jgi:UDP-MurNAc hydroxylase
VRITFLGHAGAFVETAHGSILCDPWFNPAFFASWFPFPDNSGIDLARISSPDYLYVSHSHDDHFDHAFLAAHVDKGCTVILPDFPTRDHRRALEAVGFHRFLATRNDEVAEIDGLRLLTHALVAPTDGAIGDSGLSIDDGTATLLDQNDSKPANLDAILDFGPYDGHLVQFSGAIWYPMVYRVPAEERRTLGRRKRHNQFARATRYVTEIGAREFFPFAGPPCFLDEALFHLNDFGDDPSNIFPDQATTLAEAAAAGLANGHLTVPGTVVELSRDRCEIVHPPGHTQPFDDKRDYLEDYARRAAPRIAAEKATWRAHELDVVAELRAWWTPLVAEAEHTCRGVNGRVLVDFGDGAVVVDFLDRRVDRWRGEECRYRFRIPRALLEHCIRRREPDWINALFLSCRFEAERDGPYNEFVYNFFRSLSTERMAYTERYYSEVAPPLETFVSHGYEIQRLCPHLQADLTRFGSIEDGVLTCAVHGWRFELATGRCLTADDRRLHCRAVASAAVASDAEPPDVNRGA